MGMIETSIESFRFNRTRSLGFLDQIEAMPNPQEVLAWRPGVGRAHIAWQLMHIGVTEEIFATERLGPDKSRSFTDLWPRFRGRSTPDDDIPSSAEIRHVMQKGREYMLDTLGRFSQDDLETFTWTRPSGEVLTLLTTLQIISWHEVHHHGQAHLTLNLYNQQND